MMNNRQHDALDALRAIASNTAQKPRKERKPVDASPVPRGKMTPMEPNRSQQLSPQQVFDNIVASGYDKSQVESFIQQQGLIMKALTIHQAVELLKSHDMDILKGVVPKFLEFTMEKPKQTHVLESIRSGQAAEIDPGLKMLHDLDAAEYAPPADEGVPA